MARTGFKIALFLAFVVFVIAPQHAAAQCVVSLANGFGGPSYIGNEEEKGRTSDILIKSVGATNCFSAGNTISVTYNGILTLPTTLTNSSQPQYILITNPASATTGQLVLQVSTISGISASGPQTVIQMLVIGATTDPNASITLQNLRFSVVLLAPSQTGTAMNAFVSGSSAGLTGVSSVQVGTVVSTVSTTAPPVVVTGTGQQSSGGPLTAQAKFSFSTAAGWGTSPFRVAIPKPAYPSGCVITAPPCDLVDNPTTATSLVLDVENIPSGVTVTFPSTISIWPSFGATTPSFQWKLRTTGSAAGVVTAIYDTVVATGNQVVLAVTTGAAAADSTAGAGTTAATKVTIGVQIGTASGNGTATLRVVFGPGGNPPGGTAAAAFAGDDFNAAAVPNYIPFISTTGVGREIITDGVITGPTGNDTAPTNFFTIQATQSAILFQYATDRSSYATGLAITNTGSDSTVFGATTKGQTGPVIWYLFANGSTTPIIYQTKSGDGTGLDTNGNLAPGNTLAITLDELLTAAGQSAQIGKFSGYVIALGEFNYGHGFAIFVDGQGHFSSLNSLFLGSSFRLDFPGSFGLLQ